MVCNDRVLRKGPPMHIVDLVSRGTGARLRKGLKLRSSVCHSGYSGEGRTCAAGRAALRTWTAWPIDRRGQ